MKQLQEVLDREHKELQDTLEQQREKYKEEQRRLQEEEQQHHQWLLKQKEQERMRENSANEEQQVTEELEQEVTSNVSFYCLLRPSNEKALHSAMLLYVSVVSSSQ